MMKIIFGKYRGRKIECIEDPDLRPSTSRLREGIFSILSSGQFLKDGVSVLEDAVVMDICSGTGILALESLSRGAKHAVMVDNNAKHLQLAKRNALSLGEGSNVSLIRADAATLPKSRMMVDVVFIDPPYLSNLTSKILLGLVEQAWLKPGSVIVVEQAIKEDIELGEGFEFLFDRCYGKTKVVLLEYK